MVLKLVASTILVSYPVVLGLPCILEVCVHVIELLLVFLLLICLLFQGCLRQECRRAEGTLLYHVAYVCSGLYTIQVPVRSVILTGRNRLTMHFSKRIPVLKRDVTVFAFMCLSICIHCGDLQPSFVGICILNHWLNFVLCSL